MEIRIAVQTQREYEVAQQGLRNILNVIQKIDPSILPKVVLEPPTAKLVYPTPAFNLTEAMRTVLSLNSNRWFYAQDIEQEILRDPQLGETARATQYKPGGLRKGIAASGLKLEREGVIEVDKSEGTGSYKYRWRA